MIILTSTVLLEKHFANDLKDNSLISITVTSYSNDLISMKYIKHFNKMTESILLASLKYLSMTATDHISQASLFSTTGKRILSLFDFLRIVHISCNL
jgi:hypothetical protein